MKVQAEMYILPVLIWPNLNFEIIFCPTPFGFLECPTPSQFFNHICVPYQALSIPEVRLPIKRPEKIRFKYQLPDGSKHIDEFGGLFGRVIQHEMDHLKGVFIIDRVNPLLAIKYKKKLKEIEDSSIILNISKHNKRDFVL